jgi:ketosteroid isomerase-like protein
MTVERNRELIGRFDDVVARGDVDALDELCTQDMVNHALTPDRPKGLEGTREFLRNAMPQFQNDGWTDSVTVAEGEYVVQFGVRAGIWRGGAFLGFDADPGSYSRHVAFCYRIQDGKIAERWAMRDDLTMLRQLGAFTLKTDPWSSARSLPQRTSRPASGDTAPCRFDRASSCRSRVPDRGRSRSRAVR